jgi:hypothetical protein
LVHQNCGFIGVSLDSSHFSRDWIRYALNSLTEAHQELLIVLADGLLKFTRTPVIRDGAVCLDFSLATKYVAERREQVHRFLDSEIRLLAPEKRAKVRAVEWSFFVDSAFHDLKRNVRIAYEVVASFRASVDRTAEAHSFRQGSTGLPAPSLLRLNAGYLIEEAAMCLRITELGGYSNEYHPSEDVPLLPELYSGLFSTHGLTVEALTGAPPNRRFTILKLPAR